MTRILLILPLSSTSRSSDWKAIHMHRPFQYPITRLACYFYASMNCFFAGVSEYSVTLGSTRDQKKKVVATLSAHNRIFHGSKAGTALD